MPIDIAEPLASLRDAGARLTLGLSAKGDIRLAGTKRKGRSWYLYFEPEAFTPEVMATAVRTIEAELCR